MQVVDDNETDVEVRREADGEVVCQAKVRFVDNI